VARSSPQAAGVSNGYDHPERLGVDRWLALLGAYHSVKGSVCVADCGTAITVDVVDGEGRHQGGVIAPGLALMRRALAVATDGAVAGGGSFRGVFARETEAAVQGGTVNAAAGLIEKLMAESGRVLDTQPFLILTGGDAAPVAECLRLPHEIAPLLVLQGLWLIAGKDG
jgi:type III pantothenate kinase